MRKATGIWQRYKNRTASFDAILSYLKVFPWTFIQTIAYSETTHLTEVLIANGDFW